MTVAAAGFVVMLAMAGHPTAYSPRGGDPATAAAFGAPAAQVAPAAPAAVDAGRGLFGGKGRCLTCHRGEEPGADTARDLRWIGLLRPPEKLRASVTNAVTHPAIAALMPAEIDSLVAYLRTRRKLWAVDKDGPEREIAP